jgi:ATP adenylyltransferase
MGYVSTADQPKGCIFCLKPEARDDEAHQILVRGELVYVMMNAFPYNTGHVMVAPFRHLADPLALTPEESGGLMHYVGLALEALKTAFAPEGFNIGANIGHVAGAGFAEHLHVHVVPRWSGDTNFMAVTAETRVVPEAFAETYRKLKEALPER